MLLSNLGLWISSKLHKKGGWQLWSNKSLQPTWRLEVSLPGVTLPTQGALQKNYVKKLEAEDYATSEASPGICSWNTLVCWASSRPAKTRGAVDWRDPAPVKVGIVYPHHLHLVSYILSVISLLTHQHQQYHQVCCHFHDICPMGEGPPHLEPTVIKAGDFHHPSRWFSVRWWLSHPIGKNMNWIWKFCYPHCFQGSDWKNVWNHLACIQYQG